MPAARRSLAVACRSFANRIPSSSPMSAVEPTKYAINIIHTNPSCEMQHEDDLRVISQRASKHDLILYFGREEFSDNSKYLFLHSSARVDGCRHVWCCFNKALSRNCGRAGWKRSTWAR